MRSKPGIVPLVLASLLAGASLPAQEITLTPGQLEDGLLFLDDDTDFAPFVTYVFDIDPDVVALRIELQASADLDLYVDTEYMVDYDDVIASSTSYSGTELLLLDFSTEAALISDRYYLDVAWGRPDLLIDKRGETVDRIPFTLLVTPYRLRDDGKLEPDMLVTGTIDPIGAGPYRNYHIDVPNRTRLLRVDLASDATDLDLRVRYGEPMRTLFDADQSAVSWAGSETLLIEPGSRYLTPGRYYIDVFDQAWLDWPADFALVASFEDEPPPGLRELPVLAPGKDLAAATRATVEILHDEGWGTGALLTETGFILTNYHVVERVIESSALELVDLMIGLTADPSEASRIRLLGRVVAYDRALDMALLKADTDLFGHALPADYRFPSLALGQPSAATLGDALFVIGYPGAGSLGTRASITVTQGIVSGFERRGSTVLIKTDADIAAGNSGGPVLNERLELIGIATETISEEFGNSQIGYIWPLWLVPANWWDLAGIAYSTPAR